MAKTQVTNNQLGKVPPHALEIEDTVLGQIMIDDSAIFLVSDILKPECFYKQYNAKIYGAIMRLFSNGDPINMMTVIEELRKKDDLEVVGGAYYITSLTQKVSSAAHIEYHAKIIVQKFALRELIRISSEIQTLAFESDADAHDVIEFAERSLFLISNNSSKNEPQKVSDLKSELIEDCTVVSEKPKGVMSGITNLDKKFNGFRNGDLVLVGARPSNGKTAFSLQLALNAAANGTPTAIFTLEMTKKSLGVRSIQSLSGYTKRQMESGTLNPNDIDNIKASIDNFSNLPLWIDDTPSMSIFEFRAKVRRLKMKHGIKLVVFDYIGLAKGDERLIKNQSEYIGSISQMLKSVAKECDLPVIALSQLSRDGSNVVPKLENLRSSGSLEQDADIVAFIVNGKMVNGLKYIDSNGNDAELQKTEALINVAKYREGSIGDVILGISDDCSRWMDPNDAFVESRNYSEPLADVNAFRFNTEASKDEVYPF